MTDLVLDHYDLVKRIAARVARTMPPFVEMDELVSDGVLGLIDAARLFDSSKGTKFSTYLRVRVAGSMVDEVRDREWVSRLSVRRSQAVSKARLDLSAELAREPTDLEVCDRVGRLAMGDNHATRMWSNDLRMGAQQGGPGEREEFGYEDIASPDPAKIAEDKDQWDQLGNLLEARERYIVQQYYLAGRTFREIGAGLGVTESRISQEHNRIRVKIKEWWNAREEGSAASG